MNVISWNILNLFYIFVDFFKFSERALIYWMYLKFKIKINHIWPNFWGEIITFVYKNAAFEELHVEKYINQACIHAFKLYKKKMLIPGKICLSNLLFKLVYFYRCPIKFRLSLQAAKIKRRTWKQKMANDIKRLRNKLSKIGNTDTGTFEIKG